MSFYSDYILEREGRETLESPDGFITFKISKPECYIVDIYVVPEARRTRAAFQMGDRVSEIAKKIGCTYLLGSVDVTAHGATESMKMLLAYGFKAVKTNGNMLFFTKGLS